MKICCCYWGLAFLPLLFAGGCITGKEPPEATRLISIPGGTFTLGSSSLKCGDATTPEIEHCDSGRQLDPLLWIDDLTWVPAASAIVATFEIEEHEVTNAQYLYCVESGACTPPAIQQVDGVNYFGNTEYDSYPVVYVSRAQAATYCKFVGRHLPNEAQWERAARLASGGQIRTYPWEGEQPSNCEKAGTRYLVATGCSSRPLSVEYSDADITYYKVRNMASNVSEWVLDDWNTYAYCKGGTGYDSSCQKTGTVCPQCQADGQACAKSCQPDNLVICGAGTYSVFDKNTTEHVVRGGSYLHSRCFHRLFVRRKESTPRPEIGFRCAR